MFEGINLRNDSFPLLTEQIAERLRRYISEHRLAVGEKIPNEFELAERFHVGRGTVREAVKLLISKNLLEIHRGRGTFVSENPGMVDDPFGFDYKENKLQLAADLVTVRAILEPEIAALAARNATPAEIGMMKNLVDKIEELARSNQDFSGEDSALHTLIARSSRNLVMPSLVPVIHRGIELYNRDFEKYETMEALACHRLVVEALETGDAEGARTAMRQHLAYNQQNLRNQLDPPELQI